MNAPERREGEPLLAPHLSHQCRPLHNIRWWAALGASVGECECGSTVVVPAEASPVTP